MCAHMHLCGCASLKSSGVFYVHLGTWTSACKQEKEREQERATIVFVWVNELLNRVTSRPRAQVREARVCVWCVQYLQGEGLLLLWRGLRRGQCSVRLNEERWRAVSLSRWSLLNALAPRDTSNSDQENRGAPPACRGMPPFNWAFTRD